MKEFDLMNAMNELDDKYLLEAERPAIEVRKSKRSWKRAVLIAACMCLVLAGTVLAVRDSGLFRFFEGNEWNELTGWDDDNIVSGFWASSTVEVPVSQLSDEVKVLAAEQETEMRVTFHGFGSWSSAEEFIGIEAANQPILDAASKITTTTSTDNGEVRGNCILEIWQNDSGISELVLKESCSLFDKDLIDVHFTVSRSARIMTDLAEEGPDGISGGMGYSFTKEQLEQTKMQKYTMKNGLVATIISYPIRNEKDELYGREFRAYFQEENAMITIRMKAFRYSTADGFIYLEDEPYEKLKEVLDAFE